MPTPTADLTSWFFGGPQPSDDLSFEGLFLPSLPGTLPPPLPTYTPALEPPVLTVSAVNAQCSVDLPWEKPTVMITVENPNPFNLVGLADASFEGTTGSAVPNRCLLQPSTHYADDGLYSLRVQYTDIQPPLVGVIVPPFCSVMLGPYPASPLTQYTVMANVTSDILDATMPDVEVALQFFDSQGNYLTEIFNHSLTASGTWLTAPGIIIDGTSPVNTASMSVSIEFSGQDYAASPPPSLSVTQSNPGGTHPPAAPFAYIVTAVNPLGESTGSPEAIFQGIGPLVAGSLYNTISWTAGGGHITSYNVYRGRQGLCQDLPGAFATCAALKGAFSSCIGLVQQFFAGFGLIGSTGVNSFTDTGQVAVSQVPPQINNSGPLFYVDEVGVFLGAVGNWINHPPGYAVVQRANGEFVTGASVLNPLYFSGVGEATTVFDDSVPYGEFVSYTAWINSGLLTSAPTPISTPVQMGQAPDTCSLWKRMGWAADVDANGNLISFLAGIGNMIQKIDDLSSDQMLTDGTTAPGWSQILDINRCPTYALPWLGQFVGARFPTDLRDDQQRYIIENVRTWDRGTPAWIAAQASTHLLPGYEVTINERTPDAYSFQVVVPDAGVVGNATCLSLSLQYRQCLQLPQNFATCAALWGGVEAIIAAIQSSIPAGLVATIEFV